MSSLTLTKMTGAGNDFLIWPESTYYPEDHFIGFKVRTRSELAQKLCDRHYNIGADGLVFLKPQSDSTIIWDFYNSDGSIAQMCGNASRCAARYAYDKKLIGSKNIEIITGAGPVYAQLVDNGVRVKMPPIKAPQFQQKLKLAHHNIEFDFINSGVPHAVIYKQDYLVSDILKTLCKEIQDNPLFAPDATNVTLFKVKSEGHIESVSFERGVEDFTLACGTGAVAAAYSYAQKHLKTSTVKVCVPGGELTIEFKKQETFMTGPADYIADIEYNYL